MGWLLPPERDIGVLRAPVRSTMWLLGLFVVSVLSFGLLERIGIAVWLAPVGVAGAAVSLFVVAALLAHSRRAVDFYVADRKIPAFFGGQAGAAGFAGLLTIGLAGGAFGGYTDLLVAAMGLVLGFVILAVVLAPGLRRVGAYSVGDYLGARYGGVWVRLAWAVVAIVVCMLLLVAHLKIAAPIFATVMGVTPRTALYGAAAVTVLAVLPGGMRSLTWTQAIQFFIILVACVVPAGSLIVRGTTGDIALAQEFAGLLRDALPEATGSGAVRGWVLPFLLMAFGAASLPHLSGRVLTSASARGAFLAMLWAAAYALATLAAALVLSLLLRQVGTWNAREGLRQIATLFASLPAGLAGLVIAGALAGLFAIGVASLFAATTAVSHDIWDEIFDRRGPEGRRMIVARVALILLGICAVALTQILAIEAAALLLWALALSAAGGIAPLVVGLWWRRAIDIGAIAGTVAGFGFTFLAFVLEQTGLFGGAAGGGIAAIGAPGAGVAGLLLSLVVTVGVSLAMPEPEADPASASDGLGPSETLPIRERPA